MRGRVLLRCLSIVASVALLGSLKPVFWPLLILLLAPLTEWLSVKDTRYWRNLYIAAAVLTLVGVAGAYLFGGRLLLGVARAFPKTLKWADATKQVESLIAHPSLAWRALKSQLKDNLGRGHLTGGYISVLGVMGWCEWELPMELYNSLLLGAAAALVAALLSGSPSSLRLTAGQKFFARALPLFAAIVVNLGVDFAFYLVFTPPGAPYIIGVQGRYYIGPLLLFGATGSYWASQALARLHHDRSPVRVARGLSTLLVYALVLKCQCDLVWLVFERYYHQVKPWG
jgi:uncharacterized membrane protein